MGSAPVPRRSLASFAAEKTVLFCDVWGVIHNGITIFRPAIDALRRFRAQGGTVVLVTNAPVPAERVQLRLDRMDAPRDAYDAIATAGDVAIDAIVSSDTKSLFAIGASEGDALIEQALQGSRHPFRLTGVDDADIVLCLGLDAEVIEPSGYQPVLDQAKARGLPMICANPDIVVEVGSELVYCAGAIAELYAAAGGTVIQTGKPHRRIYERALALAEPVARTPVRPDAILAIGDGAATDLAGAAAFGIDALFITSGIHREALHRSVDGSLDARALDALLAAAPTRPVAVAPFLAWED